VSARLNIRLFLDLLAALLLIAGLAYWWLDNLAHELIGTGMFLLVFSHNVFNRRWYGRIPKSLRQPRGRIVTALNLSFLAVMSVLLISSFAISRSLFSFLPFDGGRLVRDLHVLAAYWAILLVGVHIGLNWPVVMNAFRTRFRLHEARPLRTLLARTLVFVMAVTGASAVVEMGFGAKLINEVTLDMWDFNTRTPSFFVNYLAIIGLCAAVSYYASRFSLTGRKEARAPAIN
jgi:hypothetical protein